MTAKNYFDKKPEEISFYRTRKLIVDWVLPVNNLVLFATNIGLSGLIAGLADFVTPQWRLFPLLSALAALLIALCVVLQMGMAPALSAACARGPFRLLLRPSTGTFLMLVLLMSLAGLASASKSDSRGVIASNSSTVRSLQDMFLRIDSGIASANTKIDGLAATAAARQATIESTPSSLAVVSVTGADLRPDGVALHTHIFLNAKALTVKQVLLLAHTIAADGKSGTLDLTGALVAAGEGDVQQLEVKLPPGVRQITFCVAAPYPSEAHPHAVIASYTLDPSQGGTVSQVGKSTLVDTKESPCGA